MRSLAAEAENQAERRERGEGGAGQAPVEVAVVGDETDEPGHEDAIGVTEHGEGERTGEHGDGGADAGRAQGGEEDGEQVESDGEAHPRAAAERGEQAGAGWSEAEWTDMERRRGAEAGMGWGEGNGRRFLARKHMKHTKGGRRSGDTEAERGCTELHRGRRSENNRPIMLVVFWR